MRSSVLVLAVVLAGCGKSFQEADAIYKDEVAKLDALEGAIADEADSAHRSAYDHVIAERASMTKEKSRLSDEAMAKLRAAAAEVEGANRVVDFRFSIYYEAHGELLREKQKLALGQWVDKERSAAPQEKKTKEAWEAAKKTLNSALEREKMASQEAQQANASLEATIRETAEKAAEAGRLAEEEVRKRRLSEIQAQQKSVDAANQAKEAAK